MTLYATLIKELKYLLLSIFYSFQMIDEFNIERKKKEYSIFDNIKDVLYL